MKKKIIATIVGIILIVAMVVTYTMLKPNKENENQKHRNGWCRKWKERRSQKYRKTLRGEWGK